MSAAVDDTDDRRIEFVLENSSSGAIIEQSVPVGSTGDPRYTGDFRVAGVPRPGARIRSRFLTPDGSMTDGTFPTGRRVEVLNVPSAGKIEVLLVDVSIPCVFVRARDVDLTARSRPS